MSVSVCAVWWASDGWASVSVCVVLYSEQVTRHSAHTPIKKCVRAFVYTDAEIWKMCEVNLFVFVRRVSPSSSDFLFFDFVPFSHTHTPTHHKQCSLYSHTHTHQLYANELWTIHGQFVLFLLFFNEFFFSSRFFALVSSHPQYFSLRYLHRNVYTQHSSVWVGLRLRYHFSQL